LLLNRISVDSA